MKTRSEMLEDAQIARSGLPNARLADKPLRPIIIPAGTLVFVVSKSRKLSPHGLKKDHVFMSYLVGCEPEFLTGLASRTISGVTNPAQLLKVDYYTFETNNPDWPHIIVQRDRLTTEVTQ